MFVQWEEKYSVGFDIIDGQHMKLFGLLNKLSESIENHTDQMIVVSVLNELTDYTDYHFTAEEDVMEKSGYPDLPNHKLMHQALMEKVNDYRNSFFVGGDVSARDILDLLSDWLTNHILKEDTKIAKHTAENRSAI